MILLKVVVMVKLSILILNHLELPPCERSPNKIGKNPTDTENENVRHKETPGVKNNAHLSTSQ